jgi:uncharacterized protein involved in exopolysaccharide biosynthesis
MARGWESKSVEQQQADRAEPTGPVRPELSPAQKERNRQRDGLQLSRRRLLQQIQESTHPRHRQMLEQSLAEIGKQLASFE